MAERFEEKLAQQSILIIEDDQVLRKTLVRILKQWCTNIRAVGTVEDAMDAFIDRPTLVIMDVHLPDGSGLDIARHIASHPPAPMAVAISGEASAAEAFALRELGVHGYIAKPLDLERFTNELTAIIEKSPQIEPVITHLVGKESFRDVQNRVRKTLLVQALTQTNWNRTKAAKLLSVTRQAVQQMIVDFELEESAIDE